MAERIRVLIAADDAETRGKLSKRLAEEADIAVVSDGRTVVYALNRGVPFSVSNPEARVSRDVKRLAEHLLRAELPVPAEPMNPPKRRRSLLAWR